MGIGDGGGELAVIPGSHLYRIPYRWNSTRTEYDDEMQTNWIAGKIHAFTGEPLRIERLALPPGSMVSFVHHMPHHVGHRDLDAPTRWGLLMAYRTPDPKASPTKWNEGTPTPLGRARRGGGQTHPCNAPDIRGGRSFGLEDDLYLRSKKRSASPRL